MARTSDTRICDWAGLARSSGIALRGESASPGTRRRERLALLAGRNGLARLPGLANLRGRDGLRGLAELLWLPELRRLA
jgi:hypothetical protein